MIQCVSVADSKVNLYASVCGHEGFNSPMNRDRCHHSDIKQVINWVLFTIFDISSQDGERFLPLEKKKVLLLHISLTTCCYGARLGRIFTKLLQNLLDKAISSSLCR